jgi:hypothetical protein
MLAPWTEAELASAEEAARDVIRTLRQRTFEFDPTVTKPSFFGGDPLEPLLARGWQSADDDDSGTRGDETRNEGGHR